MPDHNRECTCVLALVEMDALAVFQVFSEVQNI